MALFDVIKYEGSNDVLVWRHPSQDFNTASQLIVHEAQEAILFKDGQALDCFSAGRYTLHTKNIPILSKLINLPFGGESPFHCEIYFINKVNIMDVRWGTNSAIPIQDPVYSIILPIGANGQFAIQVADSRQLLIALVGTLTRFDRDTFLSYFRGILMTSVKDLIAKQFASQEVTFLDVHSHLQAISDGIKQDFGAELLKYGITLVNFNINAIVVPEQDPSFVQLKSALSKKAEMNILGYNYQQERTFDVMDKAAANEGAGSGIMGAGLGLGFGGQLGGVIGKAMGGAVSINSTGGEPHSASPGDRQDSVCPHCNGILPHDVSFCPSCGKDVSSHASQKRCPQCNKVVPSGKFCAECGAMLNAAHICAGCGTEIPLTAHFCPNCGNAWDN